MLKTNPKNWPVQMTVTFPKEIAALIKKESQRLRMSKAGFIRQCVYAAYVKEDKR